MIMETTVNTDLVIFDLDGTLLDTIGDLAVACNAVLALRGLPQHSYEEYCHFVGNGIMRLVERALPEELRTPYTVAAVRADFVKYYTEHIDAYTKPYDGIPELVAGLVRRGVRIAVASNKFQAGTEKLVRLFFPDVPFAAVFGQREGVPLKPDPAVVEEILSLTGAAKERVLYVGDWGVDMQTAAAAAERVFRLLDEPSEIPDAPDAKVLIDTKGMVDIDHVKFGYTPEKEIIHDLRLHADPGQLVAIVGPTGAGKTTIINLLMRFYDVNEGVISVDGYPIRNLSRDSLRKAFTMVLQDTWLFQGTIEENVAYAREDATLEEVIDVCKKAHIHDFVETLPQGYQTVLTDDGVNISKGQKQLLTIARAMLSNARMLILDEATSNVDSRTEMAIQDAMLELMKGRTCFVIAHRLSTIKNADVILVLKDGDIIESGTHDELLQARGFYAKLFNSQFES